MAMERDGWSTTADSNTAVAGIDIGENCDPGNLNNADRAIMAALANHAEVTVASAGTTNILAANSEKVAISGTTTITSLGTGANRIRFVRFTGALTLTHNATSLILPGAANITTAAGDTMVVVSDASSNVRVVAYTRTSSLPALLKTANTFTANNTFSAKVSLGTPTAVTLASNNITITSSFVTVDTEGGAATDNLSVINGGSTGDLLVLSSLNGARDVTVKHGTGNISLIGGADYTLIAPTTKLMLIFDGTNWYQIRGHPA